MIKRSPQEIADFFGCHIVQDADLSWLLFQEKPVKIKSAKVGGGEHSGRIYQELIDVPEGHGWYTIYVPSKPEDKSQHQSQVYVHKEYYLVNQDCIDVLLLQVRSLMDDGWTPLGGIAVRTDEKAEYRAVYYQAMVRGM